MFQYILSEQTKVQVNNFVNDSICDMNGYGCIAVLIYSLIRIIVLCTVQAFKDFIADRTINKK